jgi:HEAT repeat protein
MSDPARFTRAQTLALAALLSSRTIAEAATATGVNERTLRRWLATPAFASAYRAAARTVAYEATTAVLAAQAEAVEVIRAALADPNPTLRLRAATQLLDLGVRFTEDDLAERLAQLEQEVAQWDSLALRIV